MCLDRPSWESPSALVAEFTHTHTHTLRRTDGPPQKGPQGSGEQLYDPGGVPIFDDPRD
jgi:hypothetical protein